METRGQEVLKFGPKIRQIFYFQLTSFALHRKLVVVLFMGGLILLASALVYKRTSKCSFFHDRLDVPNWIRQRYLKTVMLIVFFKC